MQLLISTELWQEIKVQSNGRAYAHIWMQVVRTKQPNPTEATPHNWRDARVEREREASGRRRRRSPTRCRRQSTAANHRWGACLNDAHAARHVATAPDSRQRSGRANERARPGQEGSVVAFRPTGWLSTTLRTTGGVDGGQERRWPTERISDERRQRRRQKCVPLRASPRAHACGRRRRRHSDHIIYMLCRQGIYLAL